MTENEGSIGDCHNLNKEIQQKEHKGTMLVKDI